MRDPRRTKSLRLWLPPLVAVLGLLGPTTALAAGPAPDTSPAQAHGAGRSLAPDPLPTAARPAAARAATAGPATSRPATHVQAPRPVVVRSVPVVGVQPTVVTPRVAPKHPRARHAAPRPHPAAVQITDVMPLAVDLHPHLGAAAEPLLDHSTLVLAAIALLAAVATAGSGAALVLTARELL
jgi:hypothetical protein